MCSLTVSRAHVHVRLVVVDRHAGRVTHPPHTTESNIRYPLITLFDNFAASGPRESLGAPATAVQGAWSFQDYSQRPSRCLAVAQSVGRLMLSVDLHRVQRDQRGA